MRRLWRECGALLDIDFGVELDDERYAVRATPKAACLAILNFEIKRLDERAAELRALRAQLEIDG